jgi:hypothetical protein
MIGNTSVKLEFSASTVEYRKLREQLETVLQSVAKDTYLGWLLTGLMKDVTKLAA